MVGFSDNKEKPMCFGTYVGEGDILCDKCDAELKKECINLIRQKNYF